MHMRMKGPKGEEEYVSVPSNAFYEKNKTMIEGENGFIVVPEKTEFADNEFAFRVKRPNGQNVSIDAYALAEHGIVFRIGTTYFYWNAKAGGVYVLDKPKTASGEQYTFKLLKKYDGFQVEMRELTEKEREKLDQYRKAGIIKP